MDNKLISSRTAGIPERIIAATRTADIPERTVIDKSTIFEDGIIG